MAGPTPWPCILVLFLGAHVNRFNSHWPEFRCCERKHHVWPQIPTFGVLKVLALFDELAHGTGMSAKLSRKASLFGSLDSHKSANPGLWMLMGSVSGTPQ